MRSVVARSTRRRYPEPAHADIRDKVQPISSRVDSGEEGMGGAYTSSRIRRSCGIENASRVSSYVNR